MRLQPGRDRRLRRQRSLRDPGHHPQMGSSQRPRRPTGQHQALLVLLLQAVHKLRYVSVKSGRGPRQFVGSDNVPRWLSAVKSGRCMHPPGYYPDRYAEVRKSCRRTDCNSHPGLGRRVGS